MQESQIGKKIRLLKENVDVPGFANGDITSIETAVECLEKVRLTELQ